MSKYSFLRASVEEIQEEASERGAHNPRAQMILDLLADYDALCEKTQWQPVETAPDCEHILILVHGLPAVGCTYDGRWWASLPNGEVWEADQPPTHWMPILEAPEQGGEA